MLRDKKFIRTKVTKSNEALVTVSNMCFSFNSKFCKEAELNKFNKVNVFVDEDIFKVGFEFHSREKENAFTLQFRKGSAQIKAQEVILSMPTLKKINSLKNALDKRFPVTYDSFEKLYTINISPSFEIKVSDNAPVVGGSYGIYRYLDNEEIVYIGRGNIKSRLSAPERKDWKFDRIEYSLVSDLEKQAEWETYWIRRYKEDHQGKLPYYNKIEGKS